MAAFESLANNNQSPKLQGETLSKAVNDNKEALMKKIIPEFEMLLGNKISLGTNRSI